MKSTTVKTDYKKFFGFLKGKETGKEFEKRVRRNNKEIEYTKDFQKVKELKFQ